VDAFDLSLQMSSLRKIPPLVEAPPSASPSVRARKRRAEAQPEEEEQESLPELKSDAVGKGRARNYCFTVNALPSTFYNHWETCDLPSLITYIVFQKEVAPETGHLHVQGYVQLSRPLSYKQVQVLLRSACHLEKAKGTGLQNKAYCTKTDSRLDGTDPVERGELKEQGRRSDLESLAERVVAIGSVTPDLAREFPTPYVRNYRGLQSLASLTSRLPSRGAPRVVYLYGSPGCGKSRLAHLLWPDAYKATDQKEGWFDRYNGQAEVIFDDFEGQFPLQLMKQLIDWYPMQLPIKGGFVPVAARTFIFTSNIDPLACYCNPAWERRIRDFGEIWQEDEVKQRLQEKLDLDTAALRPPRLQRQNAVVIDLTKCEHANQEDAMQCPECGP